MGFKPDFRSKKDDFPDNYNSLPERERAALMDERIRLLHIYAQHSWHMPSRIVGNKNALTVLRDAIDEAIHKACLSGWHTQALHLVSCCFAFMRSFLPPLR